MTGQIDPLLCGFCLGAQDARTTFRATHEQENGGITKTLGPAADARDIIKWHLEQQARPETFLYYEYAASRFVLIPIAIFGGTPVCDVHLFDCITRFYGGYRRDRVNR